MKHIIIVMACIVFLCLILTPNTKAQKNEESSSDKMLLWTEYETSPTIYDIAVGSDYVWGAYPKGAIRWNKQNQSYTVFTEANGLIDSNVTAVEIDHDGNVWFGSQTGLSRYDGTQWSHYTDSNGLVDNNVLSLSIGPNGEVIVGSGDGLSIYDGSSWSLFEHNYITDPNDCLSYGVHDAAIDSNGNIWKSSESAYVCYFNGTLWNVLSHEGYSVNADRFEISDNGDMWFAGVYHQNKQGVMLLEAADGTWRHFTEADGLLDDETTSVTIDKNGEAWIGINGFSKRGVSHYDGNSWISYSLSDGYYGNGVHDIQADDAGDIWTGNNYNMSRFHDNSWKAYLAGPPSGFAYEMTFDPNGHLWMSIYRNGVVEYDGQKWVHYTKANGLAGDHVYDILADQNGNLWFACYEEEWDMVGKGLTQFNGTNWTTYTENEGLTSNYINDLAMDEQDALWIAYRYNGVGKKTNSGWVNYTTADGLLSDQVGSIYAQGNDVWIGYSGGYSFGSVGASRFNSTGWVSYQSELLFNDVVNFTTNVDGHLLALAYDGVNEFDGNAWSGFAIPPMSDFISIAGDFMASDIGVDNNGVLWIVGYNSLFTFDGSSWDLYHEWTTPFSRLQDELLIDPTGDKVWVSSNHGVVELQLQEIGGQVFLPIVQNQYQKKMLL